MQTHYGTFFGNAHFGKRKEKKARHTLLDGCQFIRLGLKTMKGHLLK
jgi:hypothetical protein